MKSLSTRSLRRLALLAVCLTAITGCETVSSTSAYYVSTTSKVYPPKGKDTPMPILIKRPKNSETIGVFRYKTYRGWPFLQKSMAYNGRIHGADAVLLKQVDTKRQNMLTVVPPTTDWVPTTNFVRGRNGQLYPYTTWIPYYQPGYTQQWVNENTAIDAEMIVLDR